MSVLKRFLSDDRGTETVEWGVLAGLILAGTITAFGLIGAWVQTQIESLQTNLGA